MVCISYHNFPRFLKKKSLTQEDIKEPCFSILLIQHFTSYAHVTQFVTILDNNTCEKDFML